MTSETTLPKREKRHWKFLIIGRRRRSPTHDPDQRPEPRPTRSSLSPQPNEATAAQTPRPNPKNPSNATRVQKPNRPETRKPNPIPDADGLVHYMRSTQARSTTRAQPRPTTAPENPRLDPRPPAHASPPTCVMWHVCSATPPRLLRLIRLQKSIFDLFGTVSTLPDSISTSF